MPCYLLGVAKGPVSINVSVGAVGKQAKAAYGRTLECDGILLDIGNGIIRDGSFAILDDGRNADLLPNNRNLHRPVRSKFRSRRRGFVRDSERTLAAL